MKTITIHEVETEKVKMLRFIAYENYTKDNLKLLEKYGIHNGVGPSKWWGWLRRLTTYLFSFLDWRRHDDSFWKQKGFEYANWGILKYGFVDLAYEYRAICNLKGFKKAYRIVKFYLLIPFKVLCILLAYNAVESDIGKEAYRKSGEDLENMYND